MKGGEVYFFGKGTTLKGRFKFLALASLVGATRLCKEQLAKTGTVGKKNKWKTNPLLANESCKIKQIIK